MCKMVSVFDTRLTNSQNYWKSNQKNTQKVGFNLWHPPSQALNRVELPIILCEFFSKNVLATARCSNFLIVRFARNNEIWQSQWESNPYCQNENLAS